MDAQPLIWDKETEASVRRVVVEWRDLLAGQVPIARQIIAKLLADKLSFAPEDRDGRRGFRFCGTGTVEKLLHGTVPGPFLGVVSPRGMEGLWMPLDGWFSARRAA